LKSFHCKMTIDIFLDAECIDEAQSIMEETGLSVTRGEDGTELYVEIEDWSIKEITA
jgi:hypothetical protein